VHPSDSQRLKINEINDQPRKRYADHKWVDHEEEEDHEYVCQKGQWCSPGLRRSQKSRVQRLRIQELRQEGIKKRQVCRPKDKPDEFGRSAHTCMACFLPNEFMAPTNQIVQEETLSDVDEAEQVGLMSQLMLAKKATFDKPAKNRHMRPLYLRAGVFYRPLTFYRYPAVAVSTAVYCGIPLNTARIQISNQNRFLPLVQTVLNGIPLYK
jgi:hypothetical protein